MQDKPSLGLLGKSAEEMELACSLPGREDKGREGPHVGCSQWT